MRNLLQKLKNKDKATVILTFFSSLFTTQLFYLSFYFIYGIFVIFSESQNPENVSKQEFFNEFWFGEELGIIGLELNFFIVFVKIISVLLEFLEIIIIPILFIFSVIFLLLALFWLKITKGIWKKKKWTLIISLIFVVIRLFFSVMTFFSQDSSNFYTKTFSLIIFIILTFLLIKSIKSANKKSTLSTQN